MNRSNLKYSLIALAGLGFSMNASAADLTCSDITFTPEAFEAYEFIDKACLEVVERNGGTFAKITARIIAQTTSGPRVRIKHSDGTEGPTHKSNLSKNFLTQMDGKAVKLKDLAVRQEMNVYVGERYWSRPAVEVAKAAVAAPVAAAVAAAPPPPPPPAPAPEPEPQMLPTTASSLPLLALFGVLFLVLGGALRYSRKS